MRRAAWAGGIAGFLVAAAVLVLIGSGVAGVLRVGNTDLMYVFWPASLMLVAGWRSTIPGVMITVSSIAINCLLYVAIALLVQAGIRKLAGPQR